MTGTPTTGEPTGATPVVDDTVDLYDHEIDAGAWDDSSTVEDDDELFVRRGTDAAPSRRDAPASGGQRAERRRRRRRTLVVLALVAALVILPVLVAGGWLLWQVYLPYGSGSESAAVEVVVRPGWGTAEVADALADQGVIRSKLAFQVWARVQGSSIQAGTYTMGKGMAVSEALDRMADGPTTSLAANQVKLLVPPGLTLSQIADRVGQLPGHSREAFLTTAASGVVRSKYQPVGVTSLEGLTWPDTYFVGEGQSDEEILRLLVDTFDARADAVGLGNANPSGLSAYETIVSASLIQGEAGGADQPAVAGVIVNRLRRGMALQIDSTLCYVKGGCPPVPSNADKQIDSPYNTYRVTGLPPTPILTVGESALRAARAPAQHDYLYYVTGTDGVTRFATTFAGHEENIRLHGVRGE